MIVLDIKGAFLIFIMYTIQMIYLFLDEAKWDK
jgi:hypothetical protein